MSKTYESYAVAAAQARKDASDSGLYVGIEKRKEYGNTVYAVRFIPQPGRRYGADLRCEEVKPTDPFSDEDLRILGAKECRWCGSKFIPQLKRQEFCGDSCYCAHNNLPCADDAPEDEA